MRLIFLKIDMPRLGPPSRAPTMTHECTAVGLSRSILLCVSLTLKYKRISWGFNVDNVLQGEGGGVILSLPYDSSYNRTSWLLSNSKCKYD